jgi:hypothetical protein
MRVMTTLRLLAVVLAASALPPLAATAPVRVDE